MTNLRTPLNELVRLLIERGLQSFDASDRDDLEAQRKYSLETAEVGKAIVARGDAGAAVLRSLLTDPSETVQLLGAAWLVKLDPSAAAPTLYRLKRNASNPAVGSDAQLALMQAQDDGLLPTVK